MNYYTYAGRQQPLLFPFFVSKDARLEEGDGPNSHRATQHIHTKTKMTWRMQKTTKRTCSVCPTKVYGKNLTLCNEHERCTEKSERWKWISTAHFVCCTRISFMRDSKSPFSLSFLLRALRGTTANAHSDNCAHCCATTSTTTTTNKTLKVKKISYR